jgi:hypothetical protein
MLISEEYRAANQKLHAANPHFGTTARRYAPRLMELLSAVGARSFVDYGCGKGDLAQWFRSENIDIKVVEYDPAIPGKDVSPEPADVVACIATLEHIEPDCVDDVLDHIQQLALKAAYLVIDTVPAKKTLPDGRNAHLIVEPWTWWEKKLSQRWKILRIEDTDRNLFVAIVAPNGAAISLPQSTQSFVAPNSIRAWHALGGLIQQHSVLEICVLPGTDRELLDNLTALQTGVIVSTGMDHVMPEGNYIVYLQEATEAAIKKIWEELPPGSLIAGGRYNSDHETVNIRRAVASSFCLMDVGIAPDGVWFIEKPRAA